MIIIHGSNQVKAQEKLSSLIAEAQKKGLEIEKKEAKDLSSASLSQSLNSSSLFSSSRLIIINDLLSLPQSNNRKKLIEILKKAKTKNLIVFEGKDVHPATIKSLSALQIFHFKEDLSIYKFLESLVPGKPKPALKILKEIVDSRQSLEKLFFMLIRHTRQLIQVKTSESLKLAPWQLSKLKKQSSLFTTNQLIDLHQKLYKIDKRQKLSQIKGLETELKHLVLNL